MTPVCVASPGCRPSYRAARYFIDSSDVKNLASGRSQRLRGSSRVNFVLTTAVKSPMSAFFRAREDFCLRKKTARTIVAESARARVGRNRRESASIKSSFKAVGVLDLMRDKNGGEGRTEDASDHDYQNKVSDGKTS